MGYDINWIRKWLDNWAALDTARETVIITALSECERNLADLLTEPNHDVEQEEYMRQSIELFKERLGII